MLNIIAKNVKSKLTRKVQGKVSCHVLGNNTIVCDIICNGNTYRYAEKYTPLALLINLAPLLTNCSNIVLITRLHPPF